MQSPRRSIVGTRFDIDSRFDIRARMAAYEIEFVDRPCSSKAKAARQVFEKIIRDTVHHHWSRMKGSDDFHDNEQFASAVVESEIDYCDIRDKCSEHFREFTASILPEAEPEAGAASTVELAPSLHLSAPTPITAAPVVSAASIPAPIAAAASVDAAAPSISVAQKAFVDGELKRASWFGDQHLLQRAPAAGSIVDEKSAMHWHSIWRAVLTVSRNTCMHNG